MLRRFVYHVRRALRNMRQSPVLSLASIATVAISLALLAFFAIAVLNVQQLTSAWGEEIAVVAYMDDPPEAEAVEQWLSDILAYPEVTEVNFVSQEQAFERFRQRLGSDADLLQGLAVEVLPASMEIHFQHDARHRASVEAVVARLQQDPRFSELQYGQEWLEKFEAFLLLLRLTGVGLGSFLVFAALVIVTNTIKLTLYVRQDELEVMSLVGGTSLFIKSPYLVEGTLQGLIGGLVALGVSFLVFRLLLMEVLGQLLMITGIDTIHFMPAGWQLALVAAGGFIGLSGSLFALRKFVRIGPA